MQTLKKQINLVKNIFMIMEFEKIFPPHSVYICGLGGGCVRALGGCNNSRKETLFCHSKIHSLRIVVLVEHKL